MKYKLIFFATMLLALLSMTSVGLAQMDKFVYGTVINPDNSIPGDKEIEYRAYCVKTYADSTMKDSCDASGSWLIKMSYFASKATSTDWTIGDTLVVLFKNIGTGTFSGTKTSFRYPLKTGVENDFQDLRSTPFALPVEMVSFAAAGRDRGWNFEVVLDWKTVSESNNLGFDVLRSQDGLTFEKIGFLSGAGSTTAAQSYNFVDRNVSTGKYYYRLKQMDNDGTINYTDIQEVNLAAPERYELGQNYPNPFNPATEILFKVKEEGKVQIAVFDVLGRQVATLIDDTLPAGIHKVSFNGRSFPSGMYLYVMKSGRYHQVKKMALIK